MENLPRNPQRHPPVSRMLDDLLELLVDLDVTSDRDSPNSHPSAPTQPAPPSDRSATPEPIPHSPNNGRGNSSQTSSLITAHRQSLLKSLCLPIAPPPQNSPEKSPLPTNPQPSSNLSSPPIEQNLLVVKEVKPEVKPQIKEVNEVKSPVNFEANQSKTSPLDLNHNIETDNIGNSKNTNTEIDNPATSHVITPESRNLTASETNSPEPHNLMQPIVQPEIVPAASSPSISSKNGTKNGTKNNYSQPPHLESNQTNETFTNLGLLMDLVFSLEDVISLPPQLTREVVAIPEPPLAKLPASTLDIPLELAKIADINTLTTLEKPREDTLQDDELVINSAKIELVEKSTLEPVVNEDPLDILQRLLVNPDVYDAQKLLQSLEVSLKKLENQIYEPERLIELLLPMIAEVLSLKISQSKEEVVTAFTPIIDEVIQHRIEQDRVAMSGAIAPIISEAISRQISDSPEEIANAIGPTMGKAIQEQIRLEKDSMVDALYPIIGSTISKYMGEAIATINRQVETAFSAEGLRRKIQAKIQGVSEAELILREAIPSMVLAAFLIHKSSGLLIADAQPPQDQQLEADMIAGMLTAIRSFANDCMTNNDNSSELNQIDYSDSKIVLEVAGYCYLALVVRGQMSQDFVKKFRRSMATIVRIYNKPIMNFEGDRSTIPAEVNLLIEDMITYTDPATKPTSRYPLTLGLVILAVVSLIAIPWGIYQYRQSINNQIAQQVTTALDKTPDLSIYRLEAQIVDDQIQLMGKVPNSSLQKKAEIIAKQTSPKLAINNRIIAIDIPLDSSFTAAEVQRTTIVLNKIPGIMISAKFQEGILEINGMVKDRESVGNITKVMQNIPGVKILSNQIQLGNINQEGIARRIYFEAGSATVPADSLPQITEIKTLLSINPSFKLRITGYTDTTGDVADNQRLSTARAANVQQILLDQGIEQRQLEAKGSTGQIPGVTELWQSRFVEFELIAPNIKN